MPLDPNGGLNLASSPQSAFNPSEIPYQNAVGSLLFLVQATRPDLVHAVNYISRFNQSFNESHWGAVKRVFRYLQGTKHLCLRYSRDADCNLNGYSMVTAMPAGRQIL